MTLDLTMFFFEYDTKSTAVNIQTDQGNYLKFNYFSVSMGTVNRGEKATSGLRENCISYI